MDNAMNAIGALPNGLEVRLSWAVITLLPLAWGVFSLTLGQDINGDQLYYHYYGAASLFGGRFLQDIAAGGLSGYNNPMMYLPFVIAVDHLPARLIGFLIATWQGLNIVLVLRIARQLIPAANLWDVLLRVTVAAYLLTTPIFIMEIGRTFGDDWVSVPFLTGMSCLLHVAERRQGLHLDVLGGLLIGIAAGLKITNVPVAAAFVVAFAVAFWNGRRLVAVATAITFGVLVTSGWWLWFNYQHFGNPLFPYYNAIFKSPLFPAVNFHDSRWKLAHPRDILSLATLMAEGSTTVTEGIYRDSHWLIFSILLLVGVGYFGVQLCRRRLINMSRPALALVLFTTISFAVWAFLFHYIRYLMVTELVLPVAVAVLLQNLCGSNRGASVCLVCFTTLSASIDHYLPLGWSRIDYNEQWYQIPDLGLPSASAVILGNGIGYVERALPSNTTIIGLGTNFFFAGLPTDGGTGAVLRRIGDALWQRPTQVYHLSLSTLPLAFNPRRVEGAFGFRYNHNDCVPLQTNVGVLNVCHLMPSQRGAVPETLTPD